MAIFAKLGIGDIVEKVEIVSDNIATTEQAGVDFLNNLYGSRDVWKLTSTDGTRKNYAGIGYNYDQTRNAFIAPQPFLSWILNETTCIWEAPVAYPSDDLPYNWNETNKTWVLLEDYPSDGKRYEWNETNKTWVLLKD